MTRFGSKVKTVAREVGNEAFLFLAYAFIIFRPGSTPPELPDQDTTQSAELPDDWTAGDLDLFITEARIDVATQQADKRDIRARAQLILTTSIALGGALVTSYGSKKGLCVDERILYGAAGLSICLAALATGGIISARSDIGTVSVPALTHYGSAELRRTVASGYASTRVIGAKTIAALVTVMRDCVLMLVLGAGLLAVAHLTTR